MASSPWSKNSTTEGRATRDTGGGGGESTDDDDDDDDDDDIGNDDDDDNDDDDKDEDNGVACESADANVNARLRSSAAAFIAFISPHVRDRLAGTAAVFGA